MKTINLIGTGRVGETLMRCISATESYVIQDVSTRYLENAQAVVARTGTGRAVDLKKMKPADIWLLAVPDAQIAPVASGLVDLVQASDIAIHFSGFHAATAMAPLGEKGCHLASAHPNLSFAEPALAARSFPGTLVGVEGDSKAVLVVSDLMEALGAKTFPIASDAKVLYHAAAVFSNNFNTVLQAVAQEAWAEAGVPQDIAEALTATFLRATADNITQFGPAAALTGPAARGDAQVVEKQRKRVAQWDEATGDLYRELSTMASRLKATGKAVSD